MTEIAMPLDNREFNALVARQRAELGNFSEMLAAAFFFRMGYSVSKPLGNQKGYDLILDVGDRLLRVQVKTISTVDSVPIGYRQRTIEWQTGATKFIEVGKYTSDSFDYLAAVDRNTFEVLLIPITDLDLTKAAFFLGSKREKYKMSHLPSLQEGAG